MDSRFMFNSNFFLQGFVIGFYVVYLLLLRNSYCPAMSKFYRCWFLSRICCLTFGVLLQDCSFPAYFYTQPMATGPGFYDNLCPQSWQDGSAATWTLQDPHQQSKTLISGLILLIFCLTTVFTQPSTARATKCCCMEQRCVTVGRTDAQHEHAWSITKNIEKARESPLMNTLCGNYNQMSARRILWILKFISAVP